MAARNKEVVAVDSDERMFFLNFLGTDLDTTPQAVWNLDPVQ